MTYGYCRISTPSQNIERQERNILAVAPNAKIFKEAYTGKVMNRPEWNALQKKVKSGDVIIFDSVSRMSRTADEGITVYMELLERGIELRFIKEPAINTETYKQALQNAVPLTGTSVDLILQGVNAYLKELARVQIKIAFDQAQKEVDDLRQRTREGIETARLNGEQIGRPTGSTGETKKAKAAKEIIMKHSKTFGGSLDDEEVIKLAGISRNSYYKYKGELKITAGT